MDRPTAPSRPDSGESGPFRKIEVHGHADPVDRGVGSKLSNSADGASNGSRADALPLGPRTPPDDPKAGGSGREETGSGRPAESERAGASGARRPSDAARDSRS